jgi:hypothetical protein
MASTYTTNLGIEKIGNGEQSGTWGTTTNVNFDIIDQSVNGVQVITLAGTGSTGTPNDLPINSGSTSAGHNKFIEYTDGGDLGGTAYVRLTPETAEKIVHVRNNLSGNRSIIAFQGTYNSARDFEIPNGADVVLKFDGGGNSAATVTDVFADLTVTKVTATTVDINGGAIDGATIGANSAAAGTFSTVNIDGGTIDGTTIGGATPAAGNFTTVDIDGGTIDGATIGANSAASGNFTTVDIDGGSIDGAVVGANSAAAGTFTTVTASGLVTVASLKGTGATTVTTILDEDNMASDSATALVTQQSVKAYVDAQSSGGNVSNTGTPVNNQLAVWTNATTVEGDSGLTWNGTTLSATVIQARATTQSSGAQTLAAADMNNSVVSTGNVTVNNSVGSAGDVVIVYNNTSGNISIVAGTIGTMRLDGTTTTGTRTVAARGMAFIFFVSSTEVVVGGKAVT